MVLPPLAQTVPLLFYTSLVLSHSGMRTFLSVDEPRLQTRKTGASCQNACEIRLERVAVLGRETDSVDVLDRSTVARLAVGGFAVTPTSANGTVAIYTSDGKLVRLLSRQGLGPNELVRPTAVRRLPGDTLAIYEFGVVRESLLGLDGRILRRTKFEALPKPYAYAVCGEELVLSHHLRTPSRVGYLFHVVDLASGRITRSFGQANGGRVTVNGQVPPPRPLAAVDQSKFWAAHPELAQFELLQTTGNLVRTLTPQLAWFVAPPPGASEGVLLNGRRAVTRVYSIHAEGEELLWVFAVSATRRTVERNNKANGEHLHQKDMQDMEYRTYISAIDAKSGRVLATKVHSGLLFGPHDGLLLRRTEALSGWIESELLSFRLVSRGVSKPT